jgi:molecular chaperone GrpE
LETKTKPDIKKQNKPNNHDNKYKEIIKNLETKLKEMDLQIKDLEEKNLREKAETINYRKRKDEERAKMLKYAGDDILKDILPVIDSLGNAIKMDDNNLEDELSKFLEGFKMIYCNLISILNKNEVKLIDGANKPFDPTYHQAVISEKVEGLEPNTVAEVLQVGYLYKDRVLRPAMVRVSE